MGEREKDTSYPASLFPLRLKTRVWGHFFTQLNPNTNGVDHWETWQHGTRKSEAESVCDKHWALATLAGHQGGKPGPERVLIDPKLRAFSHGASERGR